MAKSIALAADTSWLKRCATLSLAVGSLLGSWPRAAAAQPICTSARPWVAVDGRVPAALAAAVRSDLRAGLSPGDIDVCSNEPAAGVEPLARVIIVELDAAHARFSIDVVDSVTHKRVGRDLTLDALPADGRALALAVAAEELLRASWAELALRGVHSPQTAAPPEVRAVVEQVTPEVPRKRAFTALGVRVAFERFLGGQTHYGGDLFGAIPLSSRVAGLWAMGARRALAVQAQHGAIGATALSAEAGLTLAFARWHGADLGPFVSARLLRVGFEPAAAPGASAQTKSGLALLSRVGLAFAFGRPGLIRSYSALGAGLPLKSLSAADTGGVVSGVSKLELFASAGVAWELP